MTETIIIHSYLALKEYLRWTCRDGSVKAVRLQQVDTVGLRYFWLTVTHLLRQIHVEASAEAPCL